MAALFVIYSLNGNQNHDRITKELETYEARWRVQKSSWKISTGETEGAVAKKLLACLDDEDRLIVTRIAQTSAWVGFKESQMNWLSGLI